MAARDKIHEAVKLALIKDGWLITHDPYPVLLGELRGYIDLGAEQPIAAEKQGRKIAVEIKTFIGLSIMSDLERAIGQFKLYGVMINVSEPDRILFLAVSDTMFYKVFETQAGQILIEQLQLKLVVIDLAQPEVIRWIN
ncbi:MAG: XisH family protein [Anaerolineae bacterium]|nr:XisH family protein [Anaerolineae bacterium]